MPTQSATQSHPQYLFLYEEKGIEHFMNKNTFEQVSFPKEKTSHIPQVILPEEYQDIKTGDLLQVTNRFNGHIELGFYRGDHETDYILKVYDDVILIQDTNGRPVGEIPYRGHKNCDLWKIMIKDNE